MGTTMSMNVGFNAGANADLRLGNGSGIDLDELKNNPELLERYNGKTVTVEGVNYVIEDGKVTPADQANADESIFGSNDADEIGDTFKASGAGSAEGIDGQPRVATTPEGQKILDEIT